MTELEKLKATLDAADTAVCAAWDKLRAAAGARDAADNAYDDACTDAGAARAAYREELKKVRGDD